MNRTLNNPASRVLVTAAACVLALSPVAFGQSSKKDEPLRPPTAPLATTSSPNYIAMGTGVALAALVLGVSFIPSKRGHQD